MRQLLVLLQHLRRIAASARVDPVVGVAATTATTIVVVTATTPTIVVSILIQEKSASSIRPGRKKLFHAES
nr:hypothetical protein [Aurantiacibacter xanthus]